jgi:GNAT superfamily N-acetyltransferase
MLQEDGISFRPATRDDLKIIVALLANDDLGQTRETEQEVLPSSYIEAFAAIDRDPANEVIVGVDTSGIFGTMQLTYIPNLTFEGATRCLIEGVRVSERVQGQGLSRKMFEWGIVRARENGCKIVQLTSNKARDGAIAFYDKLGFEDSHVGFKLYLD